jgi:hypothetical protein
VTFFWGKRRASSIRRVGFGNHNIDPTQAIRFFNFGSFAVPFGASANNLDDSPGTDGFKERSPANDHWVLTIMADDGGGNNHALLSHLDQLSDIEMYFAVRSFTDLVAYNNCTYSDDTTK